MPSHGGRLAIYFYPSQNSHDDEAGVKQPDELVLLFDFLLSRRSVLFLK
ncbi:MAG: hypothetical protein ACR2OA_08120 [Rubripirellula sp.]|jgi:hypothetical protein